MNSLQVHKAAYAAIISTHKYSKDQRKKATGFIGKQSNGKLMSFSCFMLDVLKSISFFCKMSQKKNVGVSGIESSLKQCICSFDEMIQNPELGATWKRLHKYFTGKDVTEEGVKIIELKKNV